MKTIIILAFVGLTLGFPGKDMTEKEFEKQFNELFDNPEDEAKAAEQLAEEEAEIDKENQLFAEGKAHYKEGIHEWDDMDDEEFAKEKFGLEVEGGVVGRRSFGLIDEPNAENTPEERARLDEIYNSLDRALPYSFDARAYGWVTPARAQQSCGSCAAFATGGAMEICLARAKAPTAITGLDISEQQLVDCAYDGNGANGCHGAWLSAYPKFIAGKQISHEYGYPYANSQPALTCQYKPYWNPGAKIDEAIVDYNCNDEKIMSLIYQYGSAVIGLYAGDHGFDNYVSGVFDTCTAPPNNINHAVLAIGWGTESGIPYWLIKNSWGKSFGDNGFIKVKRGTCGIGSSCSALRCSATGNQEAPPPKPQVPALSSCNVMKIWGQITGSYTLRYGEHESHVDCAHGSCSPKDKNVNNACVYICGQPKCG